MALELLASERPNDVAYSELQAIEDDDSAVGTYPDPERGAVGLEWLSDRLYGRGIQTDTYAEVTHSAAIGFLVAAGVFEHLGIPARDVDASLLKDARRRDVTRTVARFVFDLRAEGSSSPAVDGIAFRSRMGDEISMWAVLERSEELVIERITADDAFNRVSEDNPELLRAFEMLGLHWKAEN